MELSFRKGKVTDYRLVMKSKDGTETPVSYNATVYKDDQGKVRGVFAAARDISNALIMEEELKKCMVDLDRDFAEKSKELVKTEKKLNMLIDSTPDMIFLKDSNFRYITVNSAFEQTMGVKKENVTGKTGYRIFPSTIYATSRESDLAAIESPEPIYSEEMVGEKIFTIVKNSLKDEKGNLIGIACIGRDTTRLKKVQQELEVKIAELDTFAYTVAHDLKSPLNNLIGFVKLFREHKLKQTEKEELLERIETNADNLVTMIGDLLKLSKAGKIERMSENIETAKIFDEVLADLGNAIRENSIKIEKCTNCPTIKYSITGLREVVHNLVSNAVKFIGDGEDKKITIACSESGKEFIFHIKDNGVGISQGFMDDIYSLFKREKRVKNIPGTGAGLSIAKRIVEKHSGKIWCESELNLGSTFFFTVPK